MLTSTSISCPAYNSHMWETQRTHSTPDNPSEIVRTCSECGIEDIGNPDEFNIDYPWCEEVMDSEDGDY